VARNTGREAHRGQQRTQNGAPQILRILRELGQRAGLGLDKTRAFSRHKGIATLMIYVDEHDRETTQTDAS
jgi:hypothetical protein